MKFSRFLVYCPLFLAASGIFGAQPLAAETMTLSVDASDSPRNILHAKEEIPVRSGALALTYPEWIPGEHAPSGPVVDLAGLKIRGGGKDLPWRRDLVDMFTIHCDVPEGVSSLDVSFDFILPPEGHRFSSGASSTPGLLMLSWNQVVLYPAAEKPASITVQPTLTIHEGWKFGTSLEVDHQEGNVIRFKPVTLNQLVDSPVLCGLHFRSINLGSDPAVPHRLDLVSDGEEALQVPDHVIEEYKQLVVQANRLFGAHHYRHYDFLVTLSDHTAHFGLEHHQSSDDRVDERTMIDPELRLARAGLLPHEFVHSWNGKYRRPAGLATGDFSTPMKDDLLWVYEGLTEYLGAILTARSGLVNPEEFRQGLAMVAARMENTVGRTWRPLQDAADEASLLYDARGDWESWRRGVDFYDEGELIWLEADVTIRKLTKGEKSLNDFCRLFHGAPSTGPELKPYTFDDVVAAMEKVAPFDWRGFFTRRLQSLDPHPPLGGIEGGGWKLVYRDTLGPVLRAEEISRMASDFRSSLGFVVNHKQSIVDVIPGSAAARAGVTPTMKIVAVNGREYTPEILREAVKASEKASSPIALLTEMSGYYRTCDVAYHSGMRQPFLERDGSQPDVLDAIIAPLH